MVSIIKQKMLTKSILLILFGLASGMAVALLLDSFVFSVTQSLSGGANTIGLPIIVYLALPLAFAFVPIIKLLERLFIISQWEKGTSPSCPTCGYPMIKRTAKKGQYSGQQFWGCCQYPSCKGKIHID